MSSSSATGDAVFKIKGADELIKAMRQFPLEVQERAVKDGVAKASRQLVTAIRRQAYAGGAKTPAGFTGTLRQAIRASVGKRGPKMGKAWIGLKKARGESRIRFYYKTLEFGRNPSKRAKKSGGRIRMMDRFGRLINRYVRVRKPVKGTEHPLRPFFEAAWRANREKVSQTIVTATTAALYVQAGKLYARSRAIAGS